MSIAVKKNGATVASFKLDSNYFSTQLVLQTQFKPVMHTSYPFNNLKLTWYL